MLDPLVASFAEPLALYWRLRRVGAADTGVPPLEGRGSGRCPTLEHVPRRGTLVVQAVFPPSRT